MLRKIFQINSLINRAGFVRNISGIQHLYNNINSVKTDEDDISEEVIQATKKIAKTKERLSTTANQLINMNPVYRLRYFLNCTEKEALKMLKENPTIEGVKKAKLAEVLEMLDRNEINTENVIENPFLLTMNEDTFHAKLKIVKSLIKKKTIRGINDVVPLMQVSKLVLSRAVKINERELEEFPEGGRIYYMSQQLGVEPRLVSKYFATHMFMFGVPSELLKVNLKTMLHYNIEPIHILRDLWVFKYDPSKIKERFELCRKAGRENLRPWMVRCKMEVLEHSNRIFQQNRSLLGEDTVIDYLSKRLNYDVGTMRMIAMKHPAVLKCRVTKIKEVLDYLLDEANFQPHEIANVIRILTHSLETTKQRLEELRGLDCRPSTLSILCRSQNEYQKFIQEWLNKDQF